MEMSLNNGSKHLRMVLVVVGLIFIFGIYTLSAIWPSGWVWHTGGQSPYLQMLWGVYATLGIFLLIASRKPLEHRILIWFTVWSSVVHAGIMAVLALLHPEYRGHLYGDVPALLIVAIVLAMATARDDTSENGQLPTWVETFFDDLVYVLGPSR
jgi:hypothetical protein